MCVTEHDVFPQVQLLSEVRGVIRASDLDLFNELTIHQEIAAKKVRTLGVGTMFIWVWYTCMHAHTRDYVLLYIYIYMPA